MAKGDRTGGAATQTVEQRPTAEEQRLWLLGGFDDFETRPEQACTWTDLLHRVMWK